MEITLDTKKRQQMGHTETKWRHFLFWLPDKADLADSFLNLTFFYYRVFVWARETPNVKLETSRCFIPENTIPTSAYIREVGGHL